MPTSNGKYVHMQYVLLVFVNKLKVVNTFMFFLTFYLPILQMERKKINTTRVPNILIDDYSCKMCCRHFETLQECLKHELLDHSLTKNRPQKTVRNHLQAVLQSLKDDENVNLQTQLKQALNNCQAGEELKTILKFHCVDTEKLEQSYLRIYTCLDKELEKVGRFKIHPFGSVANGLALKSMCPYYRYTRRKFVLKKCTLLSISPIYSRRKKFKHSKKHITKNVEIMCIYLKHPLF